MEEPDMSSQERGLKHLLWLLSNFKVILPFESKWPYTLHMFSTAVVVVYNLILASSFDLLGYMLTCFGFNMLSLGVTCTTTDKYKRSVINVTVFVMKLCCSFLCFVIYVAVSDCVSVVVTYFVIMFSFELVTGGLFLKYLYTNESDETSRVDEAETETGI